MKERPTRSQFSQFPHQEGNGARGHLYSLYRDQSQWPIHRQLCGVPARGGFCTGTCPWSEMALPITTVLSISVLTSQQIFWISATENIGILVAQSPVERTEYFGGQWIILFVVPRFFLESKQNEDTKISFSFNSTEFSNKRHEKQFSGWSYLVKQKRALSLPSGIWSSHY